MKSYQQLFAELKRRKVFRVATVYGVVAFGLIQVAEPLAHNMRLPASFVPFVIALLILGFPVALVLAWAFEVSPEGVKRTSDATEMEIESIVAQPASQRWPAGLLALAGVGLLVAGAWWGAQRSSTPAPTASDAVAAEDAARLAYAGPAADVRPTIAVLPFADMSPESDQAYFSDGITEEILNTLVKIRDLKVAARTSAFAFRGRDLDMRAIGDSLGVAYLMEGSVRKSGDQLRITAQLIDAADGTHLWSESYDRAMDDVFAIQTEIAEAIARELRVPLGLDERGDLVTPTDDLEAYDLYLAGRSHMRQRGLALIDAKRLFEAAIARDSMWAPAWAALAEVMEVRIWYPQAMDIGADDAPAIAESLAGAERAARRALELDPDNASAHVALGSIQRDRGQWEGSEASYLKALELDPDLAEAHMQYAELLLIMGRIAEGVAMADTAAAFDPAPVRFAILGFALKLDGRAEEAADVFGLGAARDVAGSRPDLWEHTANVYLMRGAVEEAANMYSRTAAAGSALGYKSLLFDAQPPTEDEIKAFTYGVATGDLNRIPPDMRLSLLPEHWLRLGEPDSAIARLAWVTRLGPSGNLAWEIWEPSADSLRSDPRVQDLLASRGLQGAVARRTPAADRRRPAVLGATP